MPSHSTEHERATPLPLTGPGTVRNTAVNVVSCDNNPVSLTPAHVELLTHGLRFIPRSSILIGGPLLRTAIDRFKHRLAVATSMPLKNAATFQRVVGTSIVPLRLPPTTRLQTLSAGPVASALWKGADALFQKHGELSTNMRVHIPFNLSRTALHTMRQLRLRSDIVIRPSDKNLGVTVMSKEWYVRAALAHLTNTNAYTRIGCAEDCQKDLLDRLTRELIGILKPHLFASDLERLMKGPFRLARFYVLAKLHKHASNPLEARPITSQSGSPTEVASVMLADLLNQIVGCSHWWALRDTTALINHLDSEVVLPPDEPLTGVTSWLISADVTALYPNMQLDLMKECVDESVRLYVQQRHTPSASAATTLNLVQKLLNYVLNNCFFTFDAGDGDGAVMYKQVSGAAMGSACIPPLANLYMSRLVRDLVARWKARGRGEPTLVTAKGFMDDVFVLVHGTRADAEAFMTQLNALHPSVKLTHAISAESVAFLDLEVYRRPLSNKLLVRPYVKSLNRFLYIPPWSGHAPHMLGSFISGEVKRLVRNSSTLDDAVTAATMFMAHLLDRGYDAGFVLREFSRVSYSSRLRLLRPPPKETPPSPVVALTLPYNPVTALLPLKSMMREVQQALEYTHEHVRVTIGWTNERSLQSLLALQWPKA